MRLSKPATVRVCLIKNILSLKITENKNVFGVIWNNLKLDSINESRGFSPNFNRDILLN